MNRIVLPRKPGAAESNADTGDRSCLRVTLSRGTCFDTTGSLGSTGQPGLIFLRESRMLRGIPAPPAGGFGVVPFGRVRKISDKRKESGKTCLRRHVPTIADLARVCEARTPGKTPASRDMPQSAHASQTKKNAESKAMGHSGYVKHSII